MALSTLVTSLARSSQAAAWMQYFVNVPTYFVVGRVAGWPSNTTPVPTDALANTATAYLKDLLIASLITTPTLRLGITRNDWTSNTVYSMYDTGNPALANAAVHVYVANSANIYRCLWNASGAPSTVAPTGTANTILTTADGYKWKYLASVSNSDAATFLTSNVVPVHVLNADDGSNQWKVQQYAARPTQNGTIDIIVLDAGGIGYPTRNTIATITGDGTGATASVTVANGVVTSITMTSGGVNYSTANVTITGTGGSGASAHVIIPPHPYHGANVVAECFASYLIGRLTLTGNVGGILSTVNSYHRLGILQAPLLANSRPATSNSYNLVTSIRAVLQNPPNLPFSLDETVVGQTSAATATVVDWNVGNNSILNLTSVVGTFTVGELLIGQTSNAQAAVTTITPSPWQPLSGRLVYVVHVDEFTRSNTQAEHWQAVFEF